MHRKHAGIIFILSASIMWAVEPVLAKLAYSNSDFFHTSAIRAFFACMVAFLYMLIRNKKNLFIKKSFFIPIIYISIMGTLFADLFYFLALTMTPVINAVVIGHMQPIFIILIGFFILNEKLVGYDYAGIFCMILAGIFVSAKTIQNLLTLHIGNLGDLFVLFATIAWATTAITARKYIQIQPATIAFYRFFFASIIFLFYLTISSKLYVANFYQPCIGIAVGIGTIFYYEAIHRLKAAQVSALELSTPFFASILSLFIGEWITTLQILGILMLCIGIYFLAKKED